MAHPGSEGNVLIAPNSNMNARVVEVLALVPDATFGLRSTRKFAYQLHVPTPRKVNDSHVPHGVAA